MDDDPNGEEDGKRDKAANAARADTDRQNAIKVMLMALIRNLMIWKTWREDPPLTVKVDRGDKTSKFAIINLFFKSGTKTVEETEADLDAALDGHAPVAVHHKQRHLLVQLVLSKLQGLKEYERFNDMSFNAVGNDQIQIQWPRRLRNFNYTGMDLIKLSAWRRITSISSPTSDKKAMVVEENLCRLLVAMQGAQRIGYNTKKWKAPTVIVVWRPFKFAPAHLCKVMWTRMPDKSWVKGARADRPGRKNKEGKWQELSRKAMNTMAKKLKLPKECNIQINRHTGEPEWGTAVKELKKHAKKLEKAGITFQSLWLQSVQDAVAGMSKTLIAPFMSMTNATGSIGNFVNKDIQPINISMKLLLCGNEKEAKLLNDENRGLLQQILETTGLNNYQMPKVISANDDWRPDDKDSLNMLLRKVKTGDFNKENYEPVPDPDMNRFGKKSGFAYVLHETHGPTKDLHLLEYRCVDVKVDERKPRQKR